jgi:hypothetical protein
VIFLFRELVLILLSWPGLSRPSTFWGPVAKDVDARDKPGHDESCGLPSYPAAGNTVSAGETAHGRCGEASPIRRP